MRIDYSEPRQSGGSSNFTTHSQRKAKPPSVIPNLMVLLVLAAVFFGTGFGTGWYLSQQSAKKAFRAAMEQQSLESTPKITTKQPDQPQPQPASPQPQAPGAAAQQPQQAAPTAQIPLSFFETLPKGQKQAVLGSGINEKPKPAQPASAQSPQPTAPAPKATDVKTAPPAGYLVQVAAYNSSKEAENAKAKLSTKGYSATIVEINLNDKGTWYRLRIGRHLDKNAATEIASRLGGGAKVLPDQE